MSAIRRWASVVSPMVIASVFVGAAPTYAKTYAYLFQANGNVLKLDTETDTVVGQKRLTNVSIYRRGHVSIKAEPVANVLFVAYGEDGGVSQISVFDLKTLAFKRDLGIVSHEEPVVVAPPTGAVFFVRWTNRDPKTGALVSLMSRFDKTSLARLGDVADFPFDALGEVNNFSPDGLRLYSSSLSDFEKVAIFDTQTLRLVSTFDAAPLFSADAQDRWIAEVAGWRALLMESAATGPAGAEAVSMFTVRLDDRAQSARIATGMQGVALLTPNGGRIVFEEKKTVRDPASSEEETVSAGRLHVYDVSSGNKVSEVTVPLRGHGGFVRDVRPQGDKVYFLVNDPDPNRQFLTSVSLVTFAVLKETAIPDIGQMVFFDE